MRKLSPAFLVRAGLCVGSLLTCQARAQSAPAAPPAATVKRVPNDEPFAAEPSGPTPSIAPTPDMPIGGHTPRPPAVPSTDPTEPTQTPAVLSVPTPGQETTDPNAVEFGADNEGDEVNIPGDPFGDAAPDGLISIRSLFQARYISTFAKDSQSPRASYRVREDNRAQDNDGYSLNRIFMRIGSDPSKYVGFKAVLDFAELLDNDPEDVLKQAYASLRPIPQHLEFVVGMFKLPFSVLELDASSRYELSDFGQTNRLNGDLGFAGRDLGVQMLAAPLKKAKRLRLSLGVFRGHTHDEHDSPVGTLGGRVETKPDKHWRFGADFVQHTKGVTYNRPFNTSNSDVLPNPRDPLYPTARHWGKGAAFSGDVRYKKKGLMLRGEGQYGDRVDLDERYGAKSFWAAWGLIAYRIDLTESLRLLPAVRYEWLDADREQKDRGVQQQLTFGMTFLFWERARFVLDATRVDVQGNNTILINQPRPLQADPYMALDHVRVTGQLQLEL